MLWLALQVSDVAFSHIRNDHDKQASKKTDFTYGEAHPNYKVDFEPWRSNTK